MLKCNSFKSLRFSHLKFSERPDEQVYSIQLEGVWVPGADASFEADDSV